MYGLTFFVFLPLLLISVGVFYYALVRLGRNDPRAGSIITVGYSIGLISIIVASIMFVAFSV